MPIPDKAIEQMKANLELDEEQMKIAAEEEKKKLEQEERDRLVNEQAGQGKADDDAMPPAYQDDM